MMALPAFGYTESPAHKGEQDKEERRADEEVDDNEEEGGGGGGGGESPRRGPVGSA